MSIGLAKDNEVYIAITDDIRDLSVRDALTHNPATLDVMILGDPSDVLQVPPTLRLQLPPYLIGSLSGDCRYLRYRAIVDHID